MSKVKIGFAGLTVPEQIERGRLITGKMNGNADFPTPVPSLTDLNLAIKALEDAYNDSRGRDKTKVELMKERRREVLFGFSQLSAYVQQASAGNALTIAGSGFDVAKPATKHSDTGGEVKNVRLSDGSRQGKIRVDFDAADNAVLYVVLASLDPDFKTPEPKGITTKTHKEIGDYSSGTRIWVRVIALGREEAGTPSETVSILVR
jgi:hypothetical protein